MLSRSGSDAGVSRRDAWPAHTHTLPDVHTLLPPTSRQVARSLGLTTGPVAVVVPLSTFGSWEREMAK